MSTSKSASPERPRALVIGVQLPDVTDEEHASSLEELSRLGSTLGLHIVGRISQKRPSLSKGSVIGRGKLIQVGKATGGTGVVPSGARVKKQKGHKIVEAEDEDEDETEEGEQGDLEKASVLLFDHDLGPTQLKNVEKATGAEVLDRAGVILEIFHRHAKTREARLQVEIARLQYLTPRLRESVGRTERQRGGIGGHGGAGESKLELDRRKVRDRISELRRELESIANESGTRRSKRSDLSAVAIVGYTNAGKSSLMRRLTRDESYVADELFATLDTTVRAIHPESRPRILISDTVGFIKKLPHDLVASFRSTLEEARDADLLLHVVDASDPAFPQQIEVTRTVLQEIGASQTRLMVLNKIDRLSADVAARLAEEHPDAILMSAHDPGDVARLHARLVAYFDAQMVEATILIPFEEQKRVAELHANFRVIAERHDEAGTTVVFRAPEAYVAKLQKGLATAR